MEKITWTNTYTWEYDLDAYAKKLKDYLKDYWCNNDLEFIKKNLHEDIETDLFYARDERLLGAFNKEQYEEVINKILEKAEYPLQLPLFTDEDYEEMVKRKLSYCIKD